MLMYIVTLGLVRVLVAETSRLAMDIRTEWKCAVVCLRVFAYCISVSASIGTE
jgi:hypothetical protein